MQCYNIITRWYCYWIFFYYDMLTHSKLHWC